MQQCANLKKTFPYMEDILYVLCSPAFRSLQTVSVAFTGRLNEEGVAKAFIWSELRECANGDNPEAKGYVGVNTARDSGRLLNEITEKVKDMPMFISPELLPEGWERKNITDGPYDRQERAKEVRRELAKFGQVVLRGGTWKGIQFKPHTRAGNVHVVVVSHTEFIHQLITHSYADYGKSIPPLCEYSTTLTELR